MSLLSRFRSLFARTAWVPPTNQPPPPASPFPTTKVVVQMPPVKPPAEPMPSGLSCLAQGLIRSMRDTPGDWAGEEREGWGDETLTFRFRHRSTCVTASLYHHERGDYHVVKEVPLSDAETKMVVEAAREHLYLPPIREAQCLEDEKLKAKVTHFERLGCPNP